jgi:hypothetical protein
MTYMQTLFLRRNIIESIDRAFSSFDQIKIISFVFIRIEQKEKTQEKFLQLH